VSYINRFKLIEEVVRGRKPNARELLAQVDKQAVVNAIRKSRTALPKSIHCTNEPIEEESFARLPHKVKRRLWRIYETLPKSPQEQLPELLRLKEEYPDVPVIYNYMSMCHAQCGQFEDFHRTAKETVEKFPNYLFGKISLAEYHLLKKEHKKVPEIFDERLEIHQHYPDAVTVFHISEVRSFYSIVGIYYAREYKMARALLSYFMLEEIDSKHFATEKLANEIIYAELQKLRQRIKSNLSHRDSR
jgi:hypothetical protein